MDILHESEEGADELINALAEAEAPALLLHNLARLDETVPDERDAVHDTLGTNNLIHKIITSNVYRLIIERTK